MSHVPRLAQLRLLFLLLVAATAFAASGCYHRGVGNQEEEEEPVYVAVTNHNSLDMTIYVVRSGMRMRLGMVTTTSTGHYKLTMAQVGGDGSFQLLASPIGGRRPFYSDMLHVAPGQVVEWNLEMSLPQSSLVVRDTT